MPERQEAPQYPTSELVRHGPPDPDREAARAKSEKWCRVVALIPKGIETDDGGLRHEFTPKGPFAIPMAVRRPGTNLGSKDAWIFFTHPHSVFHKDAVFLNVPRSGGKGILDARLVARSPQGFRLYDEVGAGIAAERVPSSYSAALGVLRKRVLKDRPDGPYALDLMRLDLDALECFRLLTLCLKTRSPLNALAELDKLLKGKNLSSFTAAVFDDADRQVIREFGRLREGGSMTEVTSRFRVDENHFTQIADVKDGKGRQLVLDLLKEWQTFEATHGERVQGLGKEIGLCETEARKIALDMEREKDEQAEEGAIARMLTRRTKILKKMEDDRSKVLAKKKALEAEYDAIPGYTRVRGLTAQIAAFKKLVENVQRLATNIFDHNVSQQQIKALEDIFRKLVSGTTEEQAAAYKQYEMRMRAEVLPRLLMAFSISGYVLRRPESLPGGTSSQRNARRINRMAEDLIEYFRDSRYGDKSLGETFDDTWGQIRVLEGRF